MNVLKHLPKLHKRDKVSDQIVFYRALIDNILSPCFKTKAELYTFVQENYSTKAFGSLVIQKVILQSLNY